MNQEIMDALLTLRAQVGCGSAILGYVLGRNALLNDHPRDDLAATLSMLAGTLQQRVESQTSSSQLRKAVSDYMELLCSSAEAVVHSPVRAKDE